MGMKSPKRPTWTDGTQRRVLDRAYVTSAICTPIRISILLGQFERKHGVNFDSGTSVSAEAWQQSYPVVMRRGGYHTGYIGKNHAPIGKGGYDSGLMEKSFDYFYAGHGHIRFYPKDHHTIFHAAKADTQVEIVGEGVADFLSNEHRLQGAIRFLETRPDDKPFCLSICLNLLHSAGTSTMQMRDSDDAIYKTLYRDIDRPLPEHYIAKQDIVSPKLPADLLKVEERQVGYNYVDQPDTLIERMTRQMQAMTGMDRMVGKIRDKLDAIGAGKNTIIIFTSDHGLFMGEQGLGGKALCYEKTTHVPLVVFDPTSPPETRSHRSDKLVQSIDAAATMLDYAGIQRPDSFQGKSIRRLVQGDDQPVREYVFTKNLWSTHFGNPPIEDNSCRFRSSRSVGLSRLRDPMASRGPSAYRQQIGDACRDCQSRYPQPRGGSRQLGQGDFSLVAKSFDQLHQGGVERDVHQCAKKHPQHSHHRIAATFAASCDRGSGTITEDGHADAKAEAASDNPAPDQWLDVQRDKIHRE